ncbi:MAG: aminotransferase class V-fold PLP-dependent enzyme [Candidatus Heimdallarchaeota archaeon]|nr:aminotransferase class V-fold PLP-dependent enzyme [Candidatus Heimdallarchaeota archaeon]
MYKKPLKILEYGIANVEKRIMKLTNYLIHELQNLGNYEFISPLEEKHRSGVVNIRLPNNIELAKKLNSENIIISSRYGGLRISPHFYNTEEDIDELIRKLKQFLS